MPHGKICYLEIPAVDVQRSAAFYEQVFGWRTRTRSDGHLAFDDGVKEVSGSWVTGRPASGSPGLLIYIMVDNLADTCNAIIAAGGEVCGLVALVSAAVEPTAIQGVETAKSYKSLKDVIEQNVIYQQRPELFCFGLLGSALAADPVVKWKVQTPWPKALWQHKAAEIWAEDIARISGGRMKIDLFATDEIVPAFEVFNAVQRGTLDAGHTWSGYVIGKYNAATLFAATEDCPRRSCSRSRTTRPAWITSCRTKGGVPCSTGRRSRRCEKRWRITCAPAACRPRRKTSSSRTEPSKVST